MMKMLHVSFTFVLLALPAAAKSMAPGTLGSLSPLNTHQKEFFSKIFEYQDVTDSLNLRQANKTFYETIETIWGLHLRLGHIDRYSSTGKKLLYFYLLTGKFIVKGILESITKEVPALSKAFIKMCGQSDRDKVVVAYEKCGDILTDETINFAFEEAAYQNKMSMLRILDTYFGTRITKGANGALKWATLHKNTEMYEWLLNKFADLFTSSGIFSACCCGMSFDHVGLIINLIIKFNRQMKRQISEKLFLWAARNNRLKIIKLLNKKFRFSTCVIITAIGQINYKTNNEKLLAFLRSLLE
jgi:hypothetical protein